MEPSRLDGLAVRLGIALTAALLLVSPAVVMAQGSTQEAGAPDAIIGGGRDNQVTGEGATVAGGLLNWATFHGTVGGGVANKAFGEGSTVAGGSTNLAGPFATVGGGEFNSAYRAGGVVAGGDSNNAVEYSSTVGGGRSNHAEGVFSTISGGFLNIAAGYGATVPGGQLNYASADYSFAAGRNAVAQKPHTGTFIWADSTNVSFQSRARNEFAVRASGGVRLHTSSDLSSGAVLPAGSGSWASTSDRNSKTAFAGVDGDEVLATLMDVPIQTWSWKAEDPSIRHIGPTSQDFYQAFDVGEDALHISTVDADGVALAAIRALNGERLRVARQVRALEQRLSDVEKPGSAAGPPSTSMAWLGALALVAVGFAGGRLSKRSIGG